MYQYEGFGSAYFVETVLVPETDYVRHCTVFTGQIMQPKCHKILYVDGELRFLEKFGSGILKNTYVNGYTRIPKVTTKGYRDISEKAYSGI
jgi:hypothetical protein